jgi:hypothetical protein
VPDRFLRSIDPPRRARRVVLPERRSGPLFWRPDSWVESADAWLWQHPRLHALAMAVLIGGALLAFAWCLWRRGL